MNDVEKSEAGRFSELHLELQDWLAGYADGELDDHHTALVEAHLAGCEACRADVARQQVMSRRFQEVPTTRMPFDLQKRLDKALADAPEYSDPAPRTTSRFNLRQWLTGLYRPAVVGTGGWVVALVLAGVLLLPDVGLRSHDHIRMVSDALADYQKVAVTDLPALANTADISAPAKLAGGRLLATWHTTVGGEPAQAFAMRRGNSLVIQYRISEHVLFRNPDVRQAMATMGGYRTHEKQLEVLAVPMKEAGLLIVGPANAMPATSDLDLEPT
ncbi:anti-sigma factor family protein [Marinobacter sp. F4218]|uniref:anti-sigma factor family protein n=1 Tax=Marinobacter sp. F4218 TaxID=2862868 RepID=UPI001C62C57F|nr:zf-HC2 domain-containing protein [Marinobacter sp. F4218]MBW7469829.1 zf-HC2 domain-containing protein [Marinobacter sp. F4218]